MKRLKKLYWANVLTSRSEAAALIASKTAEKTLRLCFWSVICDARPVLWCMHLCYAPLTVIP